MHPAFCNYVCEKHEIEHQEDICPLCYHEDEDEHDCMHSDDYCAECVEREEDEREEIVRIQDGAR